jgi:serine/threonine-protein kinase
MSPEQMKSTRDVDVRTDVWALGTILFELLAGFPPFDAETMTGLIVAIMQDPPRDLARARPDLPRVLALAITTCLQKDPNARYQDVVQLASALAPFAPPRAQTSLPRIAAAIGPARSSHGPSIPPTALTAGSPHAVSAPVPGPHGTVPGRPAVLPATVSGSGASPAVTGGAVSGEWARSVASKPGPPRALLAVGIGAAAIILLGGSALAVRHFGGHRASASSGAVPPVPASPVDPSVPGSNGLPTPPAVPSFVAQPAVGAAGDAPPPSASASSDSGAKAPPGPGGHRPGVRPPPAKTAEPPREPPPPPPAKPPSTDPFGKPI